MKNDVQNFTFFDFVNSYNKGQTNNDNDNK